MKNPVAIVTGASRGIGRAIARELAGQKMRLVMVARSGDLLNEVAASIGGECLVRHILYYRRHSGNLSARSASDSLVKMRALQYKTFFSAENNAAQRRILRRNWRATQLLHARKKWRIAARYVSDRHFLKGIRTFAGAGIQLYRLARGYPTLRDI